MIFYDNYIKFNDTMYPYRKIRLKGLDDFEGYEYLIAPLSLEKALFTTNMTPVNKTAEYIDNQVFFYVSDEEVNLNTKNLNKRLIQYLL